MEIEALKKEIEGIPLSVADELVKIVSSKLDRCGLYYRVFSRRKSPYSAEKKMLKKDYEHSETRKKMQDLLGVRIALYFKDDIPICRNIVEDLFEIDYENSKIDQAANSTFKAERLNLVCKMPQSIQSLLSASIWEYPIDNTFELQIRTVFSEGWHEVDHDLHYKNEKDWEGCGNLDREMNGILATLETCDWAILHIFDSLSHKKYTGGEWGAMLRTHLRIHMADDNLSEDVCVLLDHNKSLAKELFRIDRNELISLLANSKMPLLPLTMNNLVFVANEYIIHNEDISNITPALLKKMMPPLG